MRLRSGKLIIPKSSRNSQNMNDAHNVNVFNAIATTGEENLCMDEIVQGTLTGTPILHQIEVSSLTQSPNSIANSNSRNTTSLTTTIWHAIWIPNQLDPTRQA